MIQQIINKLKWRKNILISGGAGVGKSYLLSQLVRSSELGKVQVLAPTALAAVAVGGRTVHSFFHFRLASSLDTLRMKSAERAELLSELENLDVLIIDEISMLSASLFDMIDHFLSLIKRPPALLFVGDFYQLAPISKDSKRPAAYAFTSPNWAKYDFELLLLNKQYRMHDSAFYKELSKLRLGLADASSVEYFSQFLTPLLPEKLKDYTIICGTNAEAQQINEAQLASQQGQLFRINPELACAAGVLAPNSKLMDKMLAQTPLDAQLAFKINSRVIVTMNIAGSSAYNGMQARVHSCDAAEREISLQLESGEIIKLKQSVFKFDANGDYIDDMSEAEPAFAVFGFALKLGYAITIHKSQGMSIERLVCKCDKIFATGQLYVALSRASNPASFAICYGSSRAAFANMLVQKTKIDPRVREFYEKAKLFDVNSIL